MSKQKYISITLLTVFAIIIGFSVGLKNSPKQYDHTIQGTILPYPKMLNDFNFIDQDNNPFTKSDLEGHWSLIFIGYTQCPDICPTTMSVLQQVTQSLRQQNEEPPATIFISVDPERDTPQLLGQYVGYFDEQNIGITGEKNELKRFAKDLALFFEKAAGTSGDINSDDYLVDHSSSILLLNPEGKLQAYLAAPHTAEQIIRSIQVNQQLFENS